ncbi:MAG: sporulation integral membrane protein YtvI [Oscillospiraceae bacterium]|nr:sporulation integral membrane protein YtvI [Oscillospiraceae bacterium]
MPDDFNSTDSVTTLRDATTRATQQRNRLINVAYFVLIAAAFYLFLKYAFGLVFPFLFAFLVALILQKPMRFFHQKFRIKKGFTAVVLVLLFYILIVLLLVLVGARIYTAAQGFVTYVTELVRGENLPDVLMSMQEKIVAFLDFLPASMQARFDTWSSTLIEQLMAGENAAGEQVGMWGSITSRINFDWLKTPAAGALTAATKIPSFLISVVITVISSFFMTTGYERVMNFIKRQLPESSSNRFAAIKKTMTEKFGGLIRAYAIIITVTFFELVLGFYLLYLLKFFDGEHLFAIAFLTSLVDFLPVLGTGSILTPWALYNLIMGNIGMGIGLIVMYVIIIVVRQILEPKLVSDGLGLQPIVTIAAMYIGLQLFGFVGLIVLPIAVILVKLLNDEGVIHLWKSSKQQAADAMEAENAQAEGNHPKSAG